MNWRKFTIGERARAFYLIAAAIAVSGLFKVAAFAREAFIAARFGLSSVTDAYFAIQQFPLALATYVFGAFSLAFVPAYVRSRKEDGTVDWLPGLLLWGSVTGLLLSAAMAAVRQPLVAVLHIRGSADVDLTVLILSVCFAPIVAIGLWASICTSRGHNLWAMSMTGLPYLLMTIALLAIYAAHRLNNLSLPLSMTLGFVSVGIYAAVRVLFSQPWGKPQLAVWRDAGFRSFLKQLAASSAENAGFTANQFLILYFLSLGGAGIISGNTCAMRIAMLGFTLLGIPLQQLIQAKLATASEAERPLVFRRWMVRIAALLVPGAMLLMVLRAPLVRLVYMHGKFQQAALEIVVGLMPAWVIYAVVMSLNGALARYLFLLGRGTVYVRMQLVAYVVANLIRVAVAGRMDAVWILWASVIAEGLSFAVNLRFCLGARAWQEEQASTVEVA
jgi:peptidoglycan biosynthesis protein MviN/MurJ (putative lipid II flippase)